MNKRAYGILLLLTVTATIAGVLTLIPWPTASYENVLGYKSLCTFAPAASLFCFLIAGIVCWLRASLVKETEGSVGLRLRKHAYALVPLGVVLLLAVASTVWFTSVKRGYHDGTSTATVASVFR